MKRVHMIKTADGVVHADQQAALKHLDKQFGEIIIPLARAIAEIVKFKDALEFAEKNIEVFVRLHSLKVDMTFPNEETDDDA